jgi:hypothetical protein
MHQVLVQIPVGVFLLQSYPLLLSEFPSVLAARVPHRNSENRKRETAFGFLRTGCMLPDGIDLRQEQFCEKWMSVEDTTASALDVRSATRVGTSCGYRALISVSLLAGRQNRHFMHARSSKGLSGRKNLIRKHACCIRP